MVLLWFVIFLKTSKRDNVKKSKIFLCHVGMRHIVEHFLPAPRFDSKLFLTQDSKSRPLSFLEICEEYKENIQEADLFLEDHEVDRIDPKKSVWLIWINDQSYLKERRYTYISIIKQLKNNSSNHKTNQMIQRSYTATYASRIQNQFSADPLKSIYNTPLL
ncbi:hypothetical protein YC2023_060858 [Brassica napus]